jgi:hypothetical protein
MVPKFRIFSKQNEKLRKIANSSTPELQVPETVLESIKGPFSNLFT